MSEYVGCEMCQHLRMNKIQLKMSVT